MAILTRTHTKQTVGWGPEGRAIAVTLCAHLADSSCCNVEACNVSRGDNNHWQLNLTWLPGVRDTDRAYVQGLVHGADLGRGA